MKISILSSIFLLASLTLLECTSKEDKVKTDELNIESKQIVFKSKLDLDQGSNNNERKSRIKKQDPLIRLNRNDYQNPLKRSSKAVNMPDNWDKNPFILQTYKYINSI